MSTMKLQKLVYYCQAWSLVWDEQPLFAEQIQAWANGPVIPDLFEAHKGHFSVSDWPLGNIENLSANQIESIDAVLNHYGDKSGQYLSDLTHLERPWKCAREGLASTERGSNEIPLDSMLEYYEGIRKPNTDNF